MTTTREGVENIGFESEHEAAEAYLKKWADAEELSEQDEGATDDDEGSETDPNDTDENESDTEEAEDEESEDDGENDDDDEQPTIAGDEAEVKVTVDGEERTVKVKDLKRLYGQEASLTRKSQEVADARKQAQERNDQASATIDLMLSKAQERFKPYAELDWLVVQQQLEPDEFAALRAEAKHAYEELSFIAQERDNYIDRERTRIKGELENASKEALGAIQNPEHRDHIPEWNEQLYADLRTFAVDAGLPKDDVDMIANSTVLRLLYDAMQYRKGKQVATQKKAKAATKPIKSNKKPSDKINSSPDKVRQANDRFRKSGAQEDAIDALLAKWDAQESAND